MKNLALWVAEAHEVVEAQEGVGVEGELQKAVVGAQEGVEGELQKEATDKNPNLLSYLTHPVAILPKVNGITGSPMIATTKAFAINIMKIVVKIINLYQLITFIL